jgi:hypothetical protein
VYPDSDGTVILRGRLTAEVGALLVQALAAARETLYQQARGQEAEALLAETALHHGLDPGAPGERYQAVVHVDAPVLEDGARVPAGTSQRLACDASRVVMRHDRDGRVVEVDARTRTISPALRRASLPPPGRPASARGPASFRGARRSREAPADAARW